ALSRCGGMARAGDADRGHARLMADGELRLLRRRRVVDEPARGGPGPQRRPGRDRRLADLAAAEDYFWSIRTCFDGLRYWSFSLSTDQSRPRVISEMYFASPTVALLWPSVVPKTRVLPL